jgi:hypothetical protein
VTGAVGPTGATGATGPAGVTGAPGWFNVKDPAYGAVGDGTTDDTTACQAAATAAAVAGGTLYFPRGSYKVTGLVVNPNTTMLGDGRENTLILAGANSINVITITGTAADSAYEAAHASTITGIEFGANGHTGCIGVSWIGVDFHAVSRCNFRGFTIGQHYYGSLQGRTDDCKFLGNATGIKYESTSIGYWGGVLPPNRVLVTWCFFYLNTTHAIDFAGTVGEGLFVENCELDVNGTVGNAGTSAIKFTGTGDTHGRGLIARNLWLEKNHGLAVIEIAASATIHEHSLTDCWAAYNDTTYSVSVDGSSAAQTLTARNFLHDALVVPATTSTFYRTGTTYLRLIDCNGSLAGSGGTVIQEPLLDETKTWDYSQALAIRLPNLTTTQRNAIAAPTAGMVIWNTTTSSVNRYDGSAWAEVAGGISGFATPALTLGASNVAGTATTAIRTDATILAFDTAAPANVSNVGVASATGSATVAARRDHGHALTYHSEPLTDGASNFIFDGGDIVIVNGVPN